LQVEQYLENSAIRFPEKTALICGGRRWSYSQLDRMANLLAQDLLAAGIERGDRVAVFAANSMETVVAVFAILKAGAIFLVVNPTTKADKLAYVLNHAAAAGIVCDGPRYAVLQECRPMLPCLRAAWAPGGLPDARPLEPVLESDAPAAKPDSRCIDIDVAALIYTSGSTGQPKGVTLTHLNIISASTSITNYLENTADDIIINVLPLAFDYGLYQVLMAFRMGATIVLERSFTYPAATLETIVRERVTGLPMVPTICAILLQMDLSKYDLSRLRYVTNTAAALPSSHIVELRKRLPHVTIYSMYGLTECKRVSYLPPDQIDIRTNSVGRGMPNEEVYIIDDEGRRVGPNVIGELVIRGANVMQGYWNDPEETAKRLRPGPYPWERVLYSGDLFRADEEGYLYFVGRKDDIIKSRGEKVSPREVEEVLYKLEGIAEAVVVGVPDDVLGSAIKAVVSLRPSSELTVQAVMRYCKASLEDFMVPKYIEIMAALPKTGNGKLDRKELAHAARA
jgi:amino acid adenylation domain-containing protein